MLSSSWLSFYQMIQSLTLLELASPNKTIFYFSSLHLRFYKNFSLILPHLLEIHISTHFQRQHLLSPGSWPLGRYQLSSSLPPQMGPSPSLPADMHSWACTLFLAMTHSFWSAVILQSEEKHTLSLSPYPMVHSPNGCNSQSQVDLRLGVRILFWPLPRVQGPRSWVILQCFPKSSSGSWVRRSRAAATSTGTHRDPRAACGLAS